MSEIINMRHSERPLLSSHTAFSKIKALEAGFYLGGKWQCICSAVISRETT